MLASNILTTRQSINRALNLWKTSSRPFGAKRKFCKLRQPIFVRQNFLPGLKIFNCIGGEAKPCCEFKGIVGDVKKDSIEDIWSSKALEDLRAKMLRGERDQRCWKCYEARKPAAAVCATSSIPVDLLSLIQT